MMTGMGSGRVILLNGTSSAGKTTIARTLQAVLDDPWLLAGVDSFRDMMPPRWLDDGPHAHDGFAWTAMAPAGEEPVARLQVGPVGQRMTAAMHRAVRAMADVGNDVIVDDMLVEQGWLLDWARVLDGIDAWLVGVRCPAAVLRQRERLRGIAATRGAAVGQLALVHTHGDYDLEVDTSLATPERCACRIADQVTRHRPRALARILASPPPPTPGEL